MEYVIFNGALLKKQNALLPTNDLAFLRGYGVFDFFLLAKGLPLFFEDHWQRLNRSAAAMHLQVPFSREGLLQAIGQLYAKMPLPFAGVRVTLTGGNSPDGYSLGTEPNSLITLQPLPMFADTLPNKGMALMTHNYRRPLSSVKSIDYAVGIMMQQHAKTMGFDEVLYVQDGYVSECPRANIFGINQQGVLITPDTGVLNGITRSRVLNLRQDRIGIEIRMVSLPELMTCKEVFITSTTKGIMPVYKIDHVIIGNGALPEKSAEMYGLLKAQVDAAMY
jgi:D-alanine transaminase/branched-chain amino acid aminotransferase